MSNIVIIEYKDGSFASERQTPGEDTEYLCQDSEGCFSFGFQLLTLRWEARFSSKEEAESAIKMALDSEKKIIDSLVRVKEYPVSTEL